MAALLVAMSFYSKPKEDGILNVHLTHFAGSKILKLDTLAYKNELGQSFLLTKFKYYISNIVLKNKSGKDFKLHQSFLINEEEEISKQLAIKNFPYGEYTGIEFIVGVDSLHNCSGAQSGALDPVNAMFWAWNTGYIFLKLEGKSSSSKSPGNYFEYHIGGYRQPANAIRNIHMTFATTQIVSSANKTLNLSIKVDVLEILKTPNTIDFEKLSSVTDTKNACSIADNYADMFSWLNEK